MISTYFLLALTTPARFVLIPWAILALLFCFMRPQWFGRFFGVSAVAFLVGAFLITDYANDPSVDGDGTTLFGAAILIGTFVVFGFAVFLVCGGIAVLRERYLDNRSSELENL